MQDSNSSPSPCCHAQSIMTAHDSARTAKARSRIEPRSEGRLSGREIAVKDSICVAGLPITLGDLDRPALRPRRHAAVVERVLADGVTIVGKAQCEDFCQGGQSFSSRPVAIANPHDQARSAGGSSSGSAALVGAGLVEMAMAADSAGSARIPASHCGIVGLKPTRGALPFEGIFSLEPLLETAGPMARTVAGAELLYAAMRGPDDTSPSEAAATFIPAFLAEGFISPDQNPDVAALVTEAVRSAFGSLSTLSVGAAHERANRSHLALYITGMARTLRALGQPHGALSGYNDQMAAAEAEWLGNTDAQSSELRLMRAACAAVEDRWGAQLYAAAVADIQPMTRAYDDLLERCGVLIMPTCPLLPPPIPDSTIPLAERMAASFSGTANTAPFNFTGHPAITVPVGTISGLPVGAMLVAAHGREADLFLAAKQLEQHP